MLDLVAITGAGISKASNIPTFAEMGDLRKKLSRRYFNEQPHDFFRTIMRLKESIKNAKPNDGHLALAQYEIPIVTMNIDGLHSKAKSQLVVEVHGNLDFVYCPNCNTEHEFNVLSKSIYCQRCGSILEPNIVLYGDKIRHYFNAIDLIGSANNLLVIGTSFYTSTVNDFVDRARMAGINVHIINQKAEVEVRRFLNDFKSLD